MNIQLLINIHIFLILLTILPLYNTELVIPFESKLCKANQKNIFLSDYYAQFLYTPIKIGSNKQKLEVTLMDITQMKLKTNLKKLNLLTRNYQCI